MKVLQINSVCGVGSTGRIAVDLYNELVSAGIDCLIAYGRGTAPSGDINTIRIGKSLDIINHGFFSRITDKHGFYSYAATKKFITEIKKYNPDVIHIHNIHGYYINVHLLFKYLSSLNIPIIWTLHDCWAFTGHCAHFDYINCKKWVEGCYNCPQKKAYPKSVFMDNSSWNYEHKKSAFTSVKNLRLVTPSYWLSNLVKESFLGKYPVETIYNGIDRSIFKHIPGKTRQKYHLENKIILLGVAFNWSKRKGFDDFLKLAQILPTEYQLILVGLSPKQKLLLSSNMIGLEKTADLHELVQLYSDADLFLNLTYEDNFPTTNLEALACGTPVITYHTGGSIESVLDKRCIIPKGDLNHLLALLKSSNLRDFNVDFDTRWEKNSFASEYLKLYNSVG